MWTFPIESIDRESTSRVDIAPGKTDLGRMAHRIDLDGDATDSPTTAASSPAPSTSASSTESITESFARAAKDTKKTLTRSALEQRRRRNRESMQRARERERGELEQMRVQLRQLEQQYGEAVQAHEVFLTQYTNPQLAEYNDLTHMSKELKVQNFHLQQDLEVRRKAYERMERIVQDYFIEKDDCVQEEGDDLVNAASTPAVDMGSITEAHAYELIRECCHDIERFERAVVPPSNTSYDCFGWSIKHQIVNDSKVRFQLSKSFPRVYPDRSMDEAWELYGKCEQNNLKSVRVLRLEVLQEINPDTQVVVRDIAHPLDKGVVLRTIMVRFRLKTERGLVAGRVSINPTTPPPDRHVRYADVTTWVEFQYMDPTRPDLPGCHVKFGGFADYRTKRDVSARFMNVLATVLMMEHRVLQPLMHFLPPSESASSDANASVAPLLPSQQADRG